MVVLSDDFKKKAEDKLATASAGKFFQTNNARLLPSFDRDVIAIDTIDEGEEEGAVDSDGKIYTCQWMCLYC